MPSQTQANGKGTGMTDTTESRALADVIRDWRIVRDVAERLADVKANGDDKEARRKLITHVAVCIVTMVTVWLVTRAWAAAFPMATQIGIEGTDWLYKL
jgi:hypothetical protein